MINILLKNKIISMLKFNRSLFRHLVLAALLSAFCAVAVAKDAVISAAHISGTMQSTRFEAEISSSVGFSATAVKSPYRVIIDLADVSFDLPTGAGRKAGGLISSFRYGLVEERKSRIVLDVSGPVLIGKSQVIPAKGKKPARIVLEILPTTPENFKTTYDLEHPTQNAPEASEQTAAITPAPELPIKEVKQDKRKVIVIDPGHGGVDPGAVSHKKTKEKDVVLAYGRALRDALQKSPNYNVIMTRDSDQFISLEDRVNIARENKADLFIAIHADTVDEKDVRGTTLYTVSDKATDAEAEALAQKENRADVIAGIDLGNQTKTVADILINLAQRESKNQALYFAKKAVTKLQPYARFTGKPMRSAAFVVLKAPDVPSVLVELGYLSSTEDESLLNSSDWRTNIANAMANAVDDYFGRAPAIATAN
jgi:N-acetylmuramoyl-L-alanine amidase